MRSLLSQSSHPLFIVGQEKSAGKTVALNRLRNEAHRLGEGGYGVCSVGWDGEFADHLTGGDKPRVCVFENDWVLTSADLLRTATARFELIWTDSLRGRMGRPVIGRCIRGGEVELVGPSTLKALTAAIGIMHEAGARRVLIDGAADRRTPIGAVPQAHVGLALMGVPRESMERFFDRVVDTVMLYTLPSTDLTRPASLLGESVAVCGPQGWQACAPEQLGHLDPTQTSGQVWIGGPLTVHVLESLSALPLKELVVDDPSRIFVAPRTIRRLTESGTRVSLWRRPTLDFIAVRCDGGRLRSLPPKATLEGLRERLAPLPCFDPWFSPETPGGRA